MSARMDRGRGSRLKVFRHTRERHAPLNLFCLGDVLPWIVLGLWRVSRYSEKAYIFTTRKARSRALIRPHGLALRSLVYRAFVVGLSAVVNKLIA